MTLILIFLALVSFQAETSKFRPAELKMSLTSNKARVTSDEPITVTYWIQNASDKPVLIGRHLESGFVSLKVTSARTKPPAHGSAGDHLDPRPVVSEDCSIREDWLALPPGHIYGQSRTLPHKLSGPEKYQVVAVFQVGSLEQEKYIDKCGLAVPVGIYETRPLWIEVIK